MKKYIMFIIIAVFLCACGGNQSKKENDELGPEEETIFVQEESVVIDASIKDVQEEVDASEKKVDELLKDI
jgi:PBP1b-binding outer membrane lipoprotein LpoB